MAKDGTVRGGKRQRSGPAPKSLKERTEEGLASKVVDFGEIIMPDGVDLPANEIPEPSEYLSRQQMDGSVFGAADIYRRTMAWIIARGCGGLINPQQVESYSNAFARFIQCSEAVSKYGFIGKHPTTDAPVKSPFATLEQEYQKQAFVLWNDIWTTIKSNSMTAFEDMSNVDPMERLLSGK